MMAAQRHSNSDSGDYTHPGPVRFVPAAPMIAPPLTGPERMQAEIDELHKRIRHLEAAVRTLMNQDGEL